VTLRRPRSSIRGVRRSACPARYRTSSRGTSCPKRRPPPRPGPRCRPARPARRGREGRTGSSRRSTQEARARSPPVSGILPSATT
jgi:hypothetical protein